MTATGPTQKKDPEGVSDNGGRGKGCCHAFQNIVFGGMERFFKRYGTLVARYPAAGILGCIMFGLLCGAGFMNFTEETEQTELWVPSDSEFYDQVKWMEKEFPSNNRFSQYIAVAEVNILTKQNMLFLLELKEKIDNIT